MFMHVRVEPLLTGDSFTNVTVLVQSAPIHSQRMNSKMFEVVGQCYLTAFLALFATLICHGQKVEFPHTRRYNKMNREFCYIISNYIKIAIMSSVPASLVFIYIGNLSIFLAKDENEGENETIYVDEKHGIRISQHDASVLVFIAIWLAIICLRSRNRKFHIVETSHPALVQQVSIFNALFRFCSSNEFEGEVYASPPDERYWVSWSNADLISWVKDLYIDQIHREGQSSFNDTTMNTVMTGNNSHRQYSFHEKSQSLATSSPRLQIEIDEEVMIQTLSILKTQMINGSALPYIKVGDLVAMGINYCHSIFLQVNFQSLIASESRNMNGSENGNRKGDGIDLEQWLGKKIGGNNDIENNNDNDDNHDHAPTSLPKQFNDAKEIMSSKFGVELPELKESLGGSEMDQSPPIPRMNPTNVARKSAMTSMASMTSNEGPSDVQLDPDLLNSMPPNIREIASRHPQLVQAILLEKRQALNVENSTNQRKKTIRFEMDEEADDDVKLAPPSFDDYDDEEMGDFEYSEDHEMIGLLRRRSTKQRAKPGE